MNYQLSIVTLPSINCNDKHLLINLGRPDHLPRSVGLSYPVDLGRCSELNNGREGQLFYAYCIA